MLRPKGILTIILVVITVMSCAVGCNKVPADSDEQNPMKELNSMDAYSTATGAPLSSLQPTDEGTGFSPELTQTVEVTSSVHITSKPLDIDSVTAPATSAPTPSPTPAPTEIPFTEVNYVPGYTNEPYVNFRSEPSTEADIIFICRLGTELYIIGKTDDWFRVEIDDVVGYIARPYVTAGQFVSPTPAPTTPPSMYTVYPGQFSDYDIHLVAALIHCEGPGSTYVGYRAIASVVLNRVLNESNNFPDDVPGVLFQQGQFGYSRAYLESVTPNATAMSAARYVFSSHGSTLPKKVLFYKAAYLGTTWTYYMRYYATIEGNAYFYGIIYY